MKKTILTLITTTLLAGPALAKDFSQDDIEKIIKDYLTNNPEVILDSVDAYGKRQHEADMQERQAAVEKHIDWLENNDMLPVAGNPEGDVTIVEFFDYNCGYCKKAMDDVVALIGEDDNVKFVLVDMPILGRTSELAAKWSLAAKEQDAYFEYHVGLMKNRGPLTEVALINIAKKIGLDVDKMRADAKSDKIAAKVEEKSKKASEMGISGTPAFIIDGQLYGGYIGLEKMRNAVKDARKS